MLPLRRLRQFLSDQRASLSVEAVLIFPILLWGYFGMFVLFDGYRTLGTNARASYTIADLLSRETGYVTPTYMAGMNDVLDILTQSQKPTMLRVSVVKFNDDTQDYELVWSYATSGVDAIVDATLSELLPHIPIMANPGVSIVVETYQAFEPFMNIALDAFYFESIVVTRPRFAAQLVWSDT
jgi:Flp pilus assembly protein TadG